MDASDGLTVAVGLLVLKELIASTIGWLRTRGEKADATQLDVRLVGQKLIDFEKSFSYTEARFSRSIERCDETARQVIQWAHHVELTERGLAELRESLQREIRRLEELIHRMPTKLDRVCEARRRVAGECVVYEPEERG